MGETLTIPEMGDANAEAAVVAFLVEPGDSVETGQPILEVETDKAVMEIPAEFDGVIDAFLVGSGDRVKEGVEFVRMTRRSDDTPEKTEIEVKISQAMGDVPPSKVEAATNGRSSMGDQSGEKNPSEEVVVKTDPESRKSSLSTARNDLMGGPARGYAPAGPAARRLARELGVAIADVTGSGYRGRISKADVKVFAKRRVQLQELGSGQRQVERMPLPTAEMLGPHSRSAMTGIQKATSRNITHSVSRIPHVWLQQKIDITDLEAGRIQLKEQVAKNGGSLTVTALLCKALSLVLDEFPIFNAVMDDEREEIVYREDVNIGVAVDTPRGLVVPVLRNVASASITDISCRLSAISTKARAGRLTPDDMRGASITISNLGGMGTSGIFPLINWPEVAILGVGASEWLPSYRNGNAQQPPEPRITMPLTLAFDHRLINGADGARLLWQLKALLESPFLLLFESRNARAG